MATKLAVSQSELAVSVSAPAANAAAAGNRSAYRREQRGQQPDGERQPLARDSQYEQRFTGGQRDRIWSPLQAARRARDRQGQCLHRAARSHECSQQHVRVILEEAPLEYGQARREYRENDKARRREQTP